MIRHSLLLLLSFLLLLKPFITEAKPLVADVDARGIEIHSGFDGQDLLFFGARNEPGDIVLVIRGPIKDYAVRKKEQISGIWVNTDVEYFKDVPSFYAISATNPLHTIKNSHLLDSLKIGLPSMVKAIKNETDKENSSLFLDSLLTNLTGKHLFPDYLELGDIRFSGDILFRSKVSFSEYISRGSYLAEFYLFSDGQLIAMQTTPITIKKIGFDAFIYDLANQHSLLYGIAAVLIALFSGWLANILFRHY